MECFNYLECLNYLEKVSEDQFPEHDCGSTRHQSQANAGGERLPDCLAARMAALLLLVAVLCALV